MGWLTKLFAILSATTASAALSSAEAQRRPLDINHTPEKWSVGHGTYDGKPIITRFNMGLKPFLGDHRFPNQLGIAVPFKQRTANGLPAPSEVKELDVIEKEIAKRFTTSNGHLFAGVVTTNNMREFVLYTSDARAATAKATKLRDDIKTHKIQFAIHSDPGWQNFKDLAPK